MNTLLLNRDGFQIPADGWYQVAPLGEFDHVQAGVVQVVDAEACAAMANRFAVDAKGANFAGLLVDFDHFSLDGEKRSEAAGWITALENRDGGLFAKIRWSDVGEEAVKGGRYRFLSPVWARSDCVDLGNGRVRPVRLLNAAVTNDPNLKGMRPLSNNGAGAAAGGGVAVGDPRFKWVLGETEDGRHCPSCTAAAGQVHTMAEWDAAKLRPGAGTLCCQGNCKCRLEATGDAVGGVLKDVPVRKEEAVKNGGDGGGGVSRGGAGAQRGSVVANIGWTDAARAASLAVRRAKAARRGGQGGGGAGAGGGAAGGRRSVAALLAKGYANMTPEEVRKVGKALQAKAKTGAEFTPEEIQFFQDSIDDPNAIPAVRDTGAGKGKTRKSARQKTPDPEPGDGDYRTLFEESGLEKMTPKAVQAYTEQLREKMAAGDEPLDEVEERFLSAITDNGYEGLNPDDPVFQWQVDRAKKEQRVSNREGEIAPAGRRSHTESGDGDADCVEALVNAGWTDEARVAALAVRRMKAGMRGQFDLKRKLEGGRVLRPGPLVPQPAGWAQDVRVRPPRRPDERMPGVPPGLRYPTGRAWWRWAGVAP
jgi:hypothetical protein